MRSHRGLSQLSRLTRRRRRDRERAEQTARENARPHGGVHRIDNQPREGR